MKIRKAGRWNCPICGKDLMCDSFSNVEVDPAMDSLKMDITCESCSNTFTADYDISFNYFEYNEPKIKPRLTETKHYPYETKSMWKNTLILYDSAKQSNVQAAQEYHEGAYYEIVTDTEFFDGDDYDYSTIGGLV